MSNKPRISIILPYAENYDYRYGGAIAHWVHSVVKNINYKQDVYSCSTYSNMGRSETSKYGKLVSLVKRLDYNFSNNTLIERLLYLVRKFLCRDIFFVLSVYTQIRTSDIIIVHNRPLSTLLLRKLGFKGKILLHMHNSHFLKMDSGRWLQCNKACNVIVYCSKFLMTQGLSHVESSPAKSMVVYNGIDDELSREHYFNLNTIRKKNIVFAGRLIADKGLHLLIIAFAKFTKKHPAYKLLIFGSSGSGNISKVTSYEREVLKLVSSHKLEDKVKFCGHLPQAELLSVFKQNEIVVVPSKWEEPFGMVALEAMACGCKVVATKRGGMPEFLLKNTQLVEPNSNDILKGIEQCLPGQIQPVDVSQFSWANISENYLRVIDSLND